MVLKRDFISHSFQLIQYSSQLSCRCLSTESKLLGYSQINAIIIIFISWRRRCICGSIAQSSPSIWCSLLRELFCCKCCVGVVKTKVKIRCLVISKPLGRKSIVWFGLEVQLQAGVDARLSVWEWAAEHACVAPVHTLLKEFEICHFLYGHYAKFWNLWRDEQLRAGDHARQPLRYDYLRHCVQCQRWMPYVLTRWNERVLVGRLTVFPSCPCSAERRQTFAPGCSWFFFQQWSATKRIVPRAVSIINRTCIETRKSLFGISIRLTTPCCCKCGDFQVRAQRQKHKKNYFWNLKGRD